METPTHPLDIRKRKLLLLLPVLVLPFLSLLFWVLGGGSPRKKQTEKTGFDMSLPGAEISQDKTLDKYSYYQMALADSARLREEIKEDPYTRRLSGTGLPVASGDPVEPGSSGDTWPLSAYDDGLRSGASSLDGASGPEGSEARVYQKLNRLQGILHQEDTAGKDPASPSLVDAALIPTDDSNQTAQTDEMDAMMREIRQPEQDDTEMGQLNGLLDKILAIQHPGQLKASSPIPSGTAKRLPWTKKAPVPGYPISLLETPVISGRGTDSTMGLVTTDNRFYGLDSMPMDSEQQNSVPADVPETQTLVNGATVKLRLLNDIYLNGVSIPRDHFIYGTATLEGERLQIRIKSVRYQDAIYPVSMSVYDMDGQPGVYIPGAMMRQQLKQSTGSALQNFGLTSLNPSLGAQAATTGVDMARGLLGKKVKLVRVTLRTGYRVLLKDDSSH